MAGVPLSPLSASRKPFAPFFSSPLSSPSVAADSVGQCYHQIRLRKLPCWCARSKLQAEGWPSSTPSTFHLRALSSSNRRSLGTSGEGLLYGHPLLVGFCTLPELGQSQSLKICAVISWPKWIEYLLCASVCLALAWIRMYLLCVCGRREGLSGWSPTSSL